MCAAPVSWAKAFRQHVVASSAKGWSVFPHRDQMRLQVREGEGSSSVVLPYPWQASATGDALLRVRLIYQQVCNGQTLRGAAEIVNGDSSRTEHGWAAAIERFEHHKKSFGNAVSDATWQGKYLPTLKIMLDCLESRKPPCNAVELLDSVLIRWNPGSRSRQISAQNLAQFLNYCTQRLHFKSCWMPPPKLASHVGMLPRGVGKREGYPLRDAQILRLIDSLPIKGSGTRWRFALQLLATYGLRPEELRYLVLKPRIEGPQLWCTYQKKGGGGQTRPRQLFPLPVRDLDDTAPNWNLIGRLQLREQLPLLGPIGRGGEAAITYLKRQEVWIQLKAEAAEFGEVLVPYSLRHRYSYEGHRLGIAAKDLSQAMGHSLECHLRAYARFTSQETANAFAAATAKLEKALLITN